MVVVTKIKAIREDYPISPDLTCYDATNIESLAALEVSRVLASNPLPTKKADIKMSNPSGLVDSYRPSAPKRHIFGVSANDSVQAIVKTLHRLGLVSHELQTPLVQLAARGQPLGQYFQVSLYDLDQALQDVSAEPSDKIGFKASLRNAGLLKS